MVTVTLRPWAAGDLDLLFRANAENMTEHIGGPESDNEVRARHHKYLRFWREGGARMFTILADGERVGGIGWWTTQWRGEHVQETGWFVIPEAQRQGIAGAATALIIDDAVRFGVNRLLTASPSIHNVASNALCERSGFTRGGVETFPFRGTELTVTMWTLNLEALRHKTGREPRY